MCNSPPTNQRTTAHIFGVMGKFKKKNRRATKSALNECVFRQP